MRWPAVFCFREQHCSWIYKPSSSEPVPCTARPQCSHLASLGPPSVWRPCSFSRSDSCEQSTPSSRIPRRPPTSRPAGRRAGPAAIPLDRKAGKSERSCPPRPKLPCFQRCRAGRLRGDATKEAVDIYFHVDPEDVRRCYLTYYTAINVISRLI